MYQGGWKAISAFWSRSPDLLLEDPVAGRPTPPWAPRRCRRSLDIHSGLVRAAFVRIWARSRTVPTGILEGWIPSQHRLAPKEDARAGGAWWDWVAALRPWACSASLQERWEPRESYEPVVYPPKKIPTARFRAQLLSPVAPSCRPSARGRPGGPVAMINVLPGRHVGVVPVARRSSRLVPLPWVAPQPRALVQLVQLLHALGDGPSSHAWAKHGRPAPPAAPGRRVASRFDRRRCG